MFHVEQYIKTTTGNTKQKTMNKELLLKNLRNIPDFPIPGIQFKDVTSLFKNPECLREMDNALYEMYKDKGITKIVGIESRGFVMASSLAVKLNAGFVPIRKPGMIPTLKLIAKLRQFALQIAWGIYLSDKSPRASQSPIFTDGRMDH